MTSDVTAQLKRLLQFQHVDNQFTKLNVTVNTSYTPPEQAFYTSATSALPPFAGLQLVNVNKMNLPESPPKKGKPGRKPSKVNESDEERVKRKREKNNQAAQRYRDKRMTQIKELEKEVEMLKRENSQLKETLARHVGILEPSTVQLPSGMCLQKPIDAQLASFTIPTSNQPATAAAIDVKIDVENHYQATTSTADAMEATVTMPPTTVPPLVKVPWSIPTTLSAQDPSPEGQTQLSTPLPSASLTLTPGAFEAVDAILLNKGKAETLRSSPSSTPLSAFTRTMLGFGNRTPTQPLALSPICDAMSLETYTIGASSLTSL